MNKDDQARQSPGQTTQAELATEAKSVTAEPVDLNKTTPPDQSAQATESVAESSPLVEGKGEKSEKSEQPVKKKKPWSAPVLQFLDEEEETDGRSDYEGGGVVVNPAGAKTWTSTKETIKPTLSTTSARFSPS